MEQVGRGTYSVGYVGSDDDIAEWVRAGFERADEPTEFVVESDVEAALDRVESVRERDPRTRSPLADTDPPFDCLLVTDDGDWDPVAVAERARESVETFPVVLFVGEGTEALAQRAVEAGVSAYVRIDGETSTTELTTRVLELAAEYRRRERERRDLEIARRIADRNPDIVTVLRHGGEIAYQNDRIEEVLGFDPEAVDGRLPYDRVHDDDLQDLREAFYDAVIDEEFVPRVEFRVRDADDEWRTLEARGQNLMGDPYVRGLVVTTRDVTDRRERERELESYRRIVENVGDPMYVLDMDGHFTWVNDAFVEQTGYEREFVLDTHVSAFMRESDIEEGKQVISDLLAADEDDWGRFEFVAENVEGEIRRFEDNVSLLVDDEGTVRGTVGVIRDVTEG